MATDSFAMLDSMGSLFVIKSTPLKKTTQQTKKPLTWDEDYLESLKKLDEGLSNEDLKRIEAQESIPGASLEKCEAKVNYSEFLGIFYAFLSAFAMAAMSLCAKMPDANAVQISLFRSMLQYLVLLPAVQHNKLQPWGPRLSILKYLLIRGALGSCSTLCFVAAIAMLPLGDAIAISYSYAVIVGLLSCIFLKERCGVLDVIFTIITIGGVLLIARPSFMFPSNEVDVAESGSRLGGVSLAFIGSIVTSIAYIVVRKMGQEVHVMLSLFYYSWEGAVISFLYLAISGDTSIPCLSDFPYMAGIAVLGLLGQVFTTLALQREKAGPVTLIHTTQIIIGFLFQYFVLGVAPAVTSAIGAALIMLSTVSLTARKIFAVRNGGE